MKLKLFSVAICLALASTACKSTKGIKNINNNAPNLTLAEDNTFVIADYSKDPKYGYDPQYPVNLFFRNTKNDTINQQRFLNALAGPKGQKLNYKKLESCCPFATRRTEMGAGLLDVYEISWAGQTKPAKLYLNMYEKGDLYVPLGLTLKNKEQK